MTIEGLRIKIRKKYFFHTSAIRSRFINNNDFSIISNNCWGGFVYQSYGLEYNTPTVGLFFMAEEYIKFLSDLKHYIYDYELTFIKPEESSYVSFLSKDSRFGSYPIGKLGDVEIEFLHYKSEAEAYDKWERRKKRINWDKLLVKFNDQNECNLKLFNKFSELNFRNKLFFGVNQDYASDFSIIKRRKQKCIYASQEPVGATSRCNINRLINNL